MTHSLVDHLFTKMIEGKKEPILAASAAEAALKRLDEVGEKIHEVSGEEGKNNILGYYEVKRALEQIKDYCINPNTTVSDEDHGIYYGFAYNKLKEAEKIITIELPDLNI